MTIQFEQALYTLTSDFYNDYPNSSFPELLKPHGNRTYNCIIVEYKDYFICIPFRSHMKHKNGYHFKNTVRSRHVSSGLDYSKIVIVKNATQYLSTSHILIDKDEYVEAMHHSERIISEATKYLDDYINHAQNKITLNSQEYKKRYSYSTLKYFHDILQIF
ncbi:hypothetical protein KG091_03320 [Carnobacteriaceae bacterium zg-ZUI78]|uniref:type III toxin-antitoxin system TenpIN family toxin n=1 Tax=Granulicatella sp. zg-84 TaxID=2678503 RepID=UPI0013BF1EAD|nr:hypothetical protein [Granulicatella sp. zg-84]MBS4750106.1 hypothetical protein [Carnobacteriaceae bacterium zg-ZUI78]NEW66595.1 hypothetical protein [Granulicatella sp. zg-84]QMI86246.1 hypothetical protein H1220_02515 [Carnobacteriaceae bacterium zg-84]